MSSHSRAHTGHGSAAFTPYSSRSVSCSVSQRKREEDGRTEEEEEEEEEGASEGIAIESTDR